MAGRIANPDPYVPGNKESWVGNPVPLFDTGTGYGRHPTTLLVYTHNNRDIMVIKSDDAGLSWGGEVNITAAARPVGASELILATFTGPGGGLQLSATGRLIVPMIATMSQDPNCTIYNRACLSKNARNLVIISDDGGDSWRPGAAAAAIPGCEAAVANATIQCGDEFQLAALPAGGVVGVSRSEPAPWLTWSADGGDTFAGGWTNASSVLDAGCETSMLGLKDGGPLIIASPFGTSATRQNMTISVNVAGGRGQWAQPLQLSPSADRHAGYSALGQLGNGEVLCLWETQNQTGACTDSTDPAGTADLCLGRLRI